MTEAESHAVRTAALRHAEAFRQAGIEPQVSAWLNESLEVTGRNPATGATAHVIVTVSAAGTGTRVYAWTDVSGRSARVPDGMAMSAIASL